MKKNAASAALLTAAGVALAMLLASCATSKGTTLGTVIAAQEGRESPAKPSEPPSTPRENQKGLQVITSPDKAEVWIDGNFMGLAPVVAADIGPGWHRVVVRKEGYHESSAWVQFQGDPMVYEADLERIVGFLHVSVSPPESIVTVNGSQLAQGTSTLPVGSYTVRVRAFGYTQREESVVIADRSVTDISIALLPAPFVLASFRLPKTVVNPENPGVLGTLECDISVTGPGSGSIRVTDSASNEVYSKALPDFTTWDQTFSWDLHDAAGRGIPDGAFTMTLTALGKGSDTTAELHVTFAVDRSLKIAPRAVWSGSAGLLYAPVAEVLPAGDFQAGLLGAGIFVNPLVFQAPIVLSARFGAGAGMEIDASLGVIASSVAAPLTGSLSARWNLVAPHGAYGTGMGVQAKIAAQVNPASGVAQVLMTDTFANFTGISIEVPFQVVLDRLNLLLSAGAAGSFWYPYRWDPSALPDRVPLFAAVGWLYLRAGVMVDVGSLMFGISASTRTEPLPGGIALLSSPIPFEAGAEIHWLLPGTRLLLSAIAAGEYQDSGNYYFMGGAGLGFLY